MANFIDDVSPLEFSFRVYNFGENRENVVKMFENALKNFEPCDAIQIDISSPDRNAGREKQKKKPVVKGFSSEEEE